HPDHHFDRLKYTKYKKAEYEKLLAIDEKDFYNIILEESPYSQSEESEFVLYPLGEEFDKIVIEVIAKGYAVKGLAFKTVDYRKRFFLNLESGEAFTGILESDHQFRTDRVWVTVEDEGSSEYQKGDVVEVKYLRLVLS
ncbi:MAG TPA: hypothetical protein VNQ57_04695, partial [Ureibacillus sp.]|nr:hypothetical protein [Ureibacillus sp.]